LGPAAAVHAASSNALPFAALPLHHLLAITAHGCCSKASPVAPAAAPLDSSGALKMALEPATRDWRMVIAVGDTVA
jgi:hypothetical protein